MAGKGGLIIQTYTGREAIPIENVSVTVIDDNDDNNGTRRVIAYRETDRDGFTEKVQIDTPDIENSQNPTGLPTFSAVDVQLDHPLYYSVLVEQVQIFPNNDSLQRMEMVPLPENLRDDKSRTYVVRPQNL